MGHLYFQKTISLGRVTVPELKDAESAHYLHTPTCNCARKTKNKFKHGHNCMWALDFILEYSNCDDVPESNICCCSPELSHNEILKFQMLCKDPENAKQEIFKYKKIGRVQVTSTYSQLKRRFPVQRISGRNMEMHQIYNQLKCEKKRLVNLYGNSGIGKTTLAKLVSNYLLERGYFKDRICYIDLKDVVDRDYFNNSLFSQVSNADDFGTFHEALEEKSMLFILDNCDSFIKQGLPYLQHDLREIFECNPNVKFLIITNKYSNVEMGESHVEMGNLRKIDAAKLLCKNAYEYLEYHERDIYGLAGHQILELVPLTPQGILSIVGKLQNESLNEITDTLLNNKQVQDNEFLQQKSQAETMKITLEDISKQHPVVYELLMLICQFPSGVCYKDLEELAFRQKIPDNWKEILIDFLVTKKGSHKDSTSSNNTETPPNRASFQPDNYLWLTVSQDPLDNNEVWFEPSQFMVEYVQKHLYAETSKQNLLKLEYMVLLCTTILEKMKTNHFYIETLFECSAFSTYGIWKAQKGKPGAVGDASSRLNYLQTAQFNSFIRLKKLFKRYEPTFMTCLEPQALYNSEYLQQARDSIEALCLLVPTVFKLMAPEGYKAKEGITKAERVAERIEEILKVKDVRVLILRIKLNLFAIGMAVLGSIEKPKNHILCQQKFKLMDQIKKEIRDSSVRKHVNAEIAFANAYFIYQKYKEHIKDDKFANYHQEVYTSLKKAKKLLVSFTGEEFKILKAKITLLQGIIEPNEGLYADWNLDKHLRSVKKAVLAFKTYGSLRLVMEAHFSYARIKLEIAKMSINKRAYENLIDDVKDITSELVSIRNEHLINRSLKIARKIKDKHYETQTKRKIDQYNEEIKRTYYNVITVLRATPLVSHSNQYIESGVPTVMNSVFKENIVHALTAQNKAIYLKFSILTKQSLIDSLKDGCRILQLTSTHIEDDHLCVEGSNGEVEKISVEELKEIFSPKVHYSGSMVTTDYETFSTGLISSQLMRHHFGRMGSLENSQVGTGNTVKRQSLLLFGSGGGDSATRRNSITGARRSSVTAGVGGRTSIFGRNSIFGGTPIREKSESTVTTPGSMANTDSENYIVQQRNRIIDVLIITGKPSSAILKLFIELGIPHIIVFDFSNTTLEFRQHAYQDQYLEDFSIHFYEALIRQKSIEEAFKLAKENALNYVNQVQELGGDWLNIVGAGPVLLPETAEHSEILFHFRRFPLDEGDLEDISPNKCLTNIEKMMIPFTGRNEDLYEVIRQVRAGENGVFLRVSGDMGVGKTTFALQIGDYMQRHNLFPDGVFYISLKKILLRYDQNYQIRELLRDVLGVNIRQEFFKGFFRNKKMLLIFDDFHLFLTQEISFPPYLLPVLRECAISCLFIENSKILATEPPKKKPHIRIFNPIGKEIEEELLNSVPRWDLKKLEGDQIAMIIDSIVKVSVQEGPLNLDAIQKLFIIKQCQGNLRLVISKLLERKIEIEDRTLRIDPMYLEPLNIEEEYLNAHIKSPSESRANSQPNLEVRTSLHVDESPLDLRRRIVSIDLDLTDEMGEKTPVARSKKVSLDNKMNQVMIKSPVNDEKSQNDEKLMKSVLKRLSMFEKIDMKVVKESTEEEQEDEESKLEQDEIEEREVNVVEIKELTSDSGSQESLTNTESSVGESEEDDDDEDSENEDSRD